MKNKFKLLVTLLAVLIVSSMAAACVPVPEDVIITPNSLVITFVDHDGSEISTGYYDKGDQIVVPADPRRADGEGYSYEFAGWDTEVSATAVESITYTATYSKTPIVYTVTFMADGVQIGGVLAYTVESNVVIEPEVPAKTGYTGAWKAYELTYGNVVIEAEYSLINYTMTFMNGTEVYEEVSFNVENYLSLQAPAVPEKVGYTGVWGAHDFAKFEDQVVEPSYTANTYVITYNANGGTASVPSQEVVFDSSFTLATATPSKSYQVFVGWTDEKGNKIEEGAWNIASNVTLTAKYENNLSFEYSNEIPAYLSGANTVGTLAIVDTTSSDGDKCLAIPVTGAAPSLKITMTILDEIFADPSVEYFAFDARTEQTATGNFRRYTFRTTDSRLCNVPYENDDSRFTNRGIQTYWKSFYFSRTDYEVWQDNNIEAAGNNYIIITGNFITGDTLYVDNFRPATKNDFYGFDGGSTRMDGGGVLYYTNESLKDWVMAFTGCVVTSAQLTSENKTTGLNALQFTKAAGSLAIFTPSDRYLYPHITSTGYFAFDLYVPAGSDAVLKCPKLTNSVILPAVPEKGGWITVYGTKDAGTGIAISDTTGGTYAIDNFRTVTEDEYNASSNGFEAGTGGLRLGDNVAYVYKYGNGDYSKVKYSFVVSGSSSGNISNVRLDTKITHSGDYSFAFEKTNGYIWVGTTNASATYGELKNGFTFWLYSTVAINGTGANNIVDGCNNKLNGGAGLVVPANQWIQITIPAEAMNASGRFLIIQGSTAGTIYIDDICPL